MWTDSDSNALQSVFDFCWFIWNTEFSVLGFEVSFWQLLVTCFAIILVFKTVRGLIEL